jgi:hypothetical protein
MNARDPDVHREPTLHASQHAAEITSCSWKALSRLSQMRKRAARVCESRT